MGLDGSSVSAMKAQRFQPRINADFGVIFFLTSQTISALRCAGRDEAGALKKNFNLRWPFWIPRRASMVEGDRQIQECRGTYRKGERHEGTHEFEGREAPALIVKDQN